LVFTHASSMKTRRAVFRFAWLSRQAVRAAATSGRACSAAWSVFFYRQVERDEKAADGGAADRYTGQSQTRRQLVDRLVGMARHQPANQRFVGAQGEVLLASDLPGFERPRLLPSLQQLDRKAWRYSEPTRRLLARLARLDGFNHPLAQISRIRSCHPCWPPNQWIA